MFHATGGVLWGCMHGLAHRLKSRLLERLDALSAKSAWGDQLLVRTNFLLKALRRSRFIFLNRPCHETTCSLFIFSLGLVEQFWLELPISPWPIPRRILDCWQVRSSLGLVLSRWCSTHLGDVLSAVSPSPVNSSPVNPSL